MKETINRVEDAKQSFENSENFLCTIDTQRKSDYTTEDAKEMRSMILSSGLFACLVVRLRRCSLLLLDLFR